MPDAENGRPHRRTGRPSVDPEGASAKFSVTVTSKVFDEIYTRARRERQTVSEYVRRTLQKVLEGKV